jgi:hypothetical protein
MENEDHDEKGEISLVHAIQSLPILGDEPYLFMQVMNLGIVDDYLVALERELFREYLATDSTPLPDALLVSALSQMWIFAVYELLRTWRQRCRDVLKFAQQCSELKGSKRESHMIQKQKRLEDHSPFAAGQEAPLWSAFERAAIEAYFVIQIRKAYDGSERLFRRIEALRMHLAKHERPKAPGSFAMAPGYARLDRLTGSLCWQILLRENEVDIISRREIADWCRELAIDKTKYLLSQQMQRKVKGIPEWGYGAKKVTVQLSDGTKYHRVIVVWDKEITGVLGRDDIPFNADEVVDVFQECEPDPNENMD